MFWLISYLPGSHWPFSGYEVKLSSHGGFMSLLYIFYILLLFSSVLLYLMRYFLLFLFLCERATLKIYIKTERCKFNIGKGEAREIGRIGVPALK